MLKRTSCNESIWANAFFFMKIYFLKFGTFEDMQPIRPAYGGSWFWGPLNLSSLTKDQLDTLDQTTLDCQTEMAILIWFKPEICPISRLFSLYLFVKTREFFKTTSTHEGK